jgi:hypothetical protein
MLTASLVSARAAPTASLAPGGWAGIVAVALGLAGLVVGLLRRRRRVR